MSVHFDFMNSEQHAAGFHDNHLNFDGSSSSSSGGASDLEELEATHKRSNLELFGVVFSHLTDHFTAGSDGKKKKYGVTAEKILEKTGVDINDPDNDVDVRLERHPNIEVKEKREGKKKKASEQEEDEGGDNLYDSLAKTPASRVVKSYIYNHNYSLTCASDILSLLERCHDGVYVRDVVKCYKGAEGDLGRLIKAGEVVAVGEHKPDKSKDNWVVFPRGAKYLVELEGSFSADSERQISSSQDQTDNILRGESVMVRGVDYNDTWFKVSTFVKAKDDQPVRAKAPLSVSMTGNVRQTKTYDTMAKRNESQYIYPMDETTIPLDGPLIPNNPLSNDNDPKVKLFRHGCTHDLKKRWFDTMDDPSFSKTSFSEQKLHSSLVKAGLALKSEGRAAGEEVERKRSSNKRRRKYVPKQQRLTTNTHLEGEAKISMERMLEDERRKKMEQRDAANDG
ncbi:hypothetical protein TrVE_jg9355 [Triparma verrucosa]|uniref:Uncharacterized protein n=1 Tax=Triparma verrucosa TaxID=1606542 RepID=A0A9W7DKM4_9STRA|nr:hypothetical protein TrVE_jg9355 [Triparma verrucosa]